MDARGVEASQVHARNDTQPMFRRSARRLPGMDTLERELVCLPVGWWLSDKDVASVIAAAREAVAA
jgi:dTDP-4-amino-4,6-dideoxygalactose transaminase